MTCPPDLSTLLDRVLDFAEATARAAMIPRPHVATVSANDSVAHLVELMGSGHSRYPVVQDGGDDVIGVICPARRPGPARARPRAVAGRSTSPGRPSWSRTRCRCPSCSSGCARPGTSSRACSTSTADWPVSSPWRTSPRSSSARSPTSTTRRESRTSRPETTAGPSRVRPTSRRWNDCSTTTCPRGNTTRSAG